MNKALLPSDPANNATVMASAGTGKTWLLVTRLARLLLEGAPPDGILAITFTRKAAAEMQTRLVQRLEALATASPDDLDRHLTVMGITPGPDVRERARALYEQTLAAPRPVRTTTFHAFCQEILRRFPLEADVPPGFELVEQTGELEAAALEALQSEATANPDGPLASHVETLLELCGGLAGLHQALTAFLSHRSDWWAYTEGDAEPVEAALARLREQLGIDENEDPCAAFFSSHGQALEEFAGLLAGHPTPTNLTHADALATALVAPAPSDAFALACTAFFTASGSRRSRKHSATLEKKLGADRAERFLELHHGLCAAAEQTRARINALRTLRTNGAWYRVGFALLENFQRLKREQRVLDFADLEWRAYRLLTDADNAHWVQYKLDQRIDHLLIDEFQDTNPTQWHLLLPLLEEMAAGDDPQRRRSVFLVGDAKQSIYRFRRAEPRLFETAHRWLDERLNAGLHRQHMSRRSAPAIVAMVNRIFEGPLGALLPEFDAHGTHHENRYGRVEVLPLAEPAAGAQAQDEWLGELRNPLLTPRESTPDDSHLQEGRLIATRINELVARRTPVESDTGVRPLGFGDVLILVRSRTHVAHYEKALREAGVPYTGADRGTLLQSREVQDLVALLTTLIAPYDNLALATVLRSPLFACDDEDLKILAAAGTGHWFARLQALPAESGGERLGRARRLLAGWHALAGQLPIHDLLDRIFHEGDVLGRYESAFPAHLQTRTRANLTRFLELALEIDAGRYPSLTGFLARLERLRQREQEAPDEAPGGGAGERVRIMTIHGAKGLEAAAVFLADAAAPDGSDKGYRSLVEWPPNAPKPSHFLLVGRKADRDPLARDLLEGHEAADERESANLLYVALTRARQYLFVTGTRPSRGKDTGWWGLIVQALTGEAEPALEAPLVIEQGEPPVAGAAPSGTPAPAGEVPPHLGRPVRQPFGLREIAPSHRAEPPSGNGRLDEDGRRRGIAIHRLLEYLSGEPAASAQAALAQVAAELNLPAETPLLRQWCREAEAVRSGPAFSSLFDAGRYRQAFNEVPILFSLGERTVHGIIDRVVVREDEVWIVDYKTHRIGPDEAGALAAHYRDQMVLYAEGARRLWPDLRVRSFILFTSPRLLEELETATLTPNA